MTSQDNFAVRFAKHKDELEWLFMELYHNREGLEVLEREMAEAYNARSAELKALDKARSADPDWYKRGNMFGMTIKFAFSELDFASALLRSLPCAAFSALFGCQLRILGFQLFRAWQLGDVVCLEIGCCRPVRCQLCTMLFLKDCGATFFVFL